jgi:type IV secretory pathway VirB3-like protein
MVLFIKENLINMGNFMDLELSTIPIAKYATLGIGIKIIFMVLAIYLATILVPINNNKMLNCLLLITETSLKEIKRKDTFFGSITKENSKKIRKMVLEYYFL